MSPTSRRLLPAAAAVALVGALSLPGIGSAQTAQGSFGFGAPVFVDTTLAGGEPFVAYSPVSKELVYTAHEGTTHIFSSDVPGAPAESGGWVANYRNQVNIWTSADGGKTWQVVNALAGFFSPPQDNSGFSDPDLTQDEGGRIYDTGIDLVNDAVFSSADGGRTWDRGTVQCHEGDRPWLAGGKKDEVFLSTDSDEPSGHYVFQSTDGGASCNSTGIEDQGKGYLGVGKLFYDHLRGQLVEPVLFGDGLGVGILPNASSAFGSTLGKFSQVKIAKSTVFAHWPSMAVDSAGNYYMAWDTDARAPGSSGGCGSSGAQAATGAVGVSAAETETPLANSILLSTSSDGGHHWSAPITVAHLSGHRLLWPWVTAGSAGNAAVAWYQYDGVTDPNCGSGDVSIGAAEILGALDPATMTVSSASASHRPIHSGAICQGGTTCAALGLATGEDRRLGDFFTVATDDIGCMLVASGDTTRNDAATNQPSPISHPLFIKQDSGPSLSGYDCATRQPLGNAAAFGGGSGAGASGGVQGNSTGNAVSSLPNTAAAAARSAGVAAAAVLLGLALRQRRRRRARSLD